MTTTAIYGVDEWNSCPPWTVVPKDVAQSYANQNVEPSNWDFCNHNWCRDSGDDCWADGVNERFECECDWIAMWTRE